MRKLATFTAVIALAVVGFAGLVILSIGSVNAQPGRDNVFRGKWLSSTTTPPAVAPLPEGREGYCLGFSSAPVILTEFDDDGDGDIDEDQFDGVDNDGDGLVDEDIVGLGGRGRIYMTHGFVAGGDTADVRVYDVQNDVWLDDSDAFGQLPLADPASAGTTSEGVGVSQGGLVYCMGGRVAGSGVARDVLEAYNPTTNGWTGLAPMRARAGLAAAVVGSRIYAVGGRSATGGPCTGAPLNVAEAYDIPSDTWADITPPTFPVTDATAIAHGGKVFLIGGCTVAAGLANVTDKVQIYDRNTDTWTQGATMPTLRANLALGVIGNTIYAIGGIDATTANLDDVEAYDVDKDQWSINLADKTTPASEIHGVSHAGKIFVPGSGAFGMTSSVFEVFKKK